MFEEEIMKFDEDTIKGVLALCEFHKCNFSNHSKGQLISKQDCRAITSPKKTNVGFLLLSLLLQG